ncbi:response regulator [Thalassotalea maritima]|uniref:response regulator n=1 Tax=Thalassotalea maritima TaxID=3242416 RepID=UPI0035272DF0
MIQAEKIIIADDHPLFRQALLGVLSNKMPQVNWIQAEHADQLEGALQQHTDSDLLLLDLDMPNAHGFNTLIRIRSEFAHIPVVIISAFEDDETIAKAIDYGASGYIPKSTPPEEMFAAINCVMQGEVWLPQGNQVSHSHDDIAERLASLTSQQYKVLRMFADGMLNKQIAYDLHVSEATIKAHATAIFKKLKVRNRTQAVIAISHLQLEHHFSE